MDNKVKILIVAGILVVAVVGFVLFTMQGAGSNAGGNTGASSGATGGSTDTATASMIDTSTKPAYTPPKPPPVIGPSALTGVSTDIFANGPPPPKKPKALPPPPTVTVKAIPFAVPKRDRGFTRRNWSNMVPVVTKKSDPIGRLAGWIFNNHGQVIALFEDESGVVRSVGVGDELGGMRVKSISRDNMVLVDDLSGRETKIKLQGLDTFQSKSTAVEAQQSSDTASDMPTYPGTTRPSGDAGDQIPPPVDDFEPVRMF